MRRDESRDQIAVEAKELITRTEQMLDEMRSVLSKEADAEESISKNLVEEESEPPAEG